MERNSIIDGGRRNERATQTPDDGLIRYGQIKLCRALLVSHRTMTYQPDPNYARQEWNSNLHRAEKYQPKSPKHGLD